MDELSLLRRIRTDVHEPDPATLDRARTLLLEKAATFDPATGRPQTRARPVLRWAGFSAVGVAALTATLVATDLLGFAGWRGGADAAAADVLNTAALDTTRNADPVVPAGQYLKVETDSVYGTTDSPDGVALISYLTIGHDELYVPADRSDEWIWARSFREPFQSFTPEGEALARESYERQVREAGGIPELLRAPDAEFYGSSVVPDFDALPRDPHRLLNHIYRSTIGSGPSVDGAALSWIADTLRTGVVPADLRAALYEAAARIPGVQITEEVANLDGRTGVSIGRVESANDTRRDLILDPNTGELIGEREITLTDNSGFPAGTTTSYTAVSTSVATTAPAGATYSGPELDENGCILDSGFNCDE